MKTKVIGALAFGAAVGIGAGAAQAAPWTVSVGGRLQATPPYEGAGHDILVPVPTLSIRRPGSPERVALPDDALGLNLLGIGPVSFGPNLRLRARRDDFGVRAGLHTVALAIEPGAFVTIWPTDWLRLHAEVRRGVRGHHGWVEDGGLDLVARSGRWTATIGPRVGFGDHSYMSAYFGVTPADAAANSLITSAYASSGGLRYVGGEATAVYRISESWQAVANLGYHRLGDKPADSPVVQAIGSRDEISAGAGFKYSFTWSP